MLCHLHAGLFEIKGNIFKLTDQIKYLLFLRIYFHRDAGWFWKVHQNVIMHDTCAVKLGSCAVY